MQLHKRFTSDQVKALLKGYHQGILDRPIEEILGINKSRFFALLTRYRREGDNFALAYQRSTPTRIPVSAEREIERELMLEKDLIEDATLPITTYNYSAVKDRLIKHGVTLYPPSRILGVDVTYALSPQAKGKVERPYRWLQDVTKALLSSWQTEATSGSGEPLRCCSGTVSAS
jgi:hypothetical protein